MGEGLGVREWRGGWPACHWRLARVLAPGSARGSVAIPDGVVLCGATPRRSRGLIWGKSPSATGASPVRSTPISAYRYARKRPEGRRRKQLLAPSFRLLAGCSITMPSRHFPLAARQWHPACTSVPPPPQAIAAHRLPPALDRRWRPCSLLPRGGGSHNIRSGEAICSISFFARGLVAIPGSVVLRGATPPGGAGGSLGKG